VLLSPGQFRRPPILHLPDCTVLRFCSQEPSKSLSPARLTMMPISIRPKVIPTFAPNLLLDFLQSIALRNGEFERRNVRVFNSRAHIIRSSEKVRYLADGDIFSFSKFRPNSTFAQCPVLCMPEFRSATAEMGPTYHRNVNHAVEGYGSQPEKVGVTRRHDKAAVSLPRKIEDRVRRCCRCRLVADLYTHPRHSKHWQLPCSAVQPPESSCEAVKPCVWRLPSYIIVRLSLRPPPVQKNRRWGRGQRPPSSAHSTTRWSRPECTRTVNLGLRHRAILIVRFLR
jgi:hypothetical protein